MHKIKNFKLAILLPYPMNYLLIYFYQCCLTYVYMYHVIFLYIDVF